MLLKNLKKINNTKISQIFPSLRIKLKLITIAIILLFNFLIKPSFSLNSKIQNLNKRFFLRPFAKFDSVEHYLKTEGKFTKIFTQDFITIEINIYTLLKNMKLAYQENFKSSKKLDFILKNLKIPLKNIKTLSFNMREKYKDVYDTEKKIWLKIFEGYEVSNKISIKLNDLKLASDLIQKSVNIGNLIILGVNFEIDREKNRKFEGEILKKATEKALEKAKILSKSLRIYLDDVKKINVEINYPEKKENIGYGREYAMAKMSAPSVELFSGKDKVEGKVEINFLTLKR